MQTVTSFDTSEYHIQTELIVKNLLGDQFELTAVVDTGAPWTEFNDAFLIRAGLFEIPASNVAIRAELQTQKYAKVVLPSITICGHTLQDLNVMVSRFDDAWGIGALVGLDFFRRFRVTIDYGNAVLVCDPLHPPAAP